ncbi:FtsX-like permease family protein [Agrococcus jejuensis]|uniref:FtsX-like permease family protein n=1 Tax=Agrococcus jejuensis TaxID=399736 RepID=A0A1G8D8Q1_9MICO|nr:FtsX-like permease family protein [Agrococcus jejuensis]SDH54106.1 FtsX-like permease family protein [Agrococcus jejuensis]
MSSLRLAPMLLRPSTQGAAVLALPVVAFGVTTWLLGIVLGGARAFFTWSGSDAATYQMLAVVALALLAVPLATLGGSAARLSARRRDDRLAALRLLGATSGTVLALAVGEATILALVGAIVGASAAFATAPLIGLIPFAGEPLGSSAMLPPLWSVGLVVAVTLLAAASALLSMRRVMVTPLGVARRDAPARVHWAVVLVAVALMGVVYAVFSSFSTLGEALGIAVLIAILGAGFGIAMLVLNLLGPWIVGVQARIQVRNASSPARLIAARTVLESPKAAWRQVGGVALVTFVGVIAGVGSALLGSAGGDFFLADDIRTGLIITVVGSFITVACTVGLQQAASILDGRALSRALHHGGMDVGTMDAARRWAVLSPLLLVVAVSAIAAGVLVVPLLGMALLTQPLTVMITGGVVVLGVVLVGVGLLATRPLLRRVATAHVATA